MILKLLFMVAVVVLFIRNVSFFSLYLDNTIFGWLFKGTYIMCIVLLPQFFFNRGRYFEWVYIIIMLIGFWLHTFFTEIEDPMNDAFQWIFIVVIIIVSRSFRPPIFFCYLVISFFIMQSVMVIIEFQLQMNLFNYQYTEIFQERSSSVQEFRAFGMMSHPLTGANVQLIIMSFLLVNNKINKFFRVGLLLLGTYALFGFNSRAAIIIWGFILFYRLVLYKTKPIYTIILGILIYLLFINSFSLFVQNNSQIFGRLSEVNNLQDDSVGTRLMSYVLFWNETWDFHSSIVGGRIIYMPDTKISLENGALLTITWWGWVIGILKIILELIISYKLLNQYNYKDKFILLLGSWFLAFTNNNTMDTFVFVFFVITFLAMKSLSWSKLDIGKLKFNREVDYHYKY